MDIRHQMIGTTLLFKYNDPVFNEISVIQYKRQLAAQIEKNNVQDIILDVENLRIVDNTGLGALLFARRYTFANGNRCILGMPRPKLISLLKTAKLTESFTIMERKEEYQAYLKALVEKQDQEKAEREAEKARKAEEAKKAQKAEEAEKEEDPVEAKDSVEEKDSASQICRRE